MSKRIIGTATKDIKQGETISVTLNEKHEIVCEKIDLTDHGKLWLGIHALKAIINMMEEEI